MGIVGRLLGIRRGDGHVDTILVARVYSHTESAAFHRSLSVPFPVHHSLPAHHECVQIDIEGWSFLVAAGRASQPPRAERPHQA